MWLTKSKNKVYQLPGSPRLSEPSHKMYLDLARGIQNLLPLALDVFARPGGLT